MSHNIVKLLHSNYGLSATAAAGFGSLLADAEGGGSKFYIVLAIVVIILIMGYFDQRQKAKLYKDDMVPIPIVISVDHNTSMTHLDLLVNEIEKSDPKFKNHRANLEKYFNITEDMLMFKYDGYMYDEDRITSFLQIIRYELNDIQNRLKGKALFHLFYLKRPAFGIAIGSIFERDAIVVYQNNDSKNAIDRIATIVDSRQYKDTVKQFKHFDIIKDFENRQSKKLLFIIQISSKDIPRDNPDLTDFENVVTLRRRVNRSIPTDEESVNKGIWVEHAQEIYNIMNEYKSNYPDITIAHAMPEGVAILLGMGIANYWDVKVTQYDKGSYPTVINLQKIEYYF